VVDDPIKGAEDAESPLIRDKVYDWFQSSVQTRAHPDTAIAVIATRWHHDDLIGRLSQLTYPDGTPVWKVINLPAIDANGNALWEAQRPLKWLERERHTMTSYFWSALYMGRPVPRGESVFGTESRYSAGERATSESGALDVGAYLQLGQRLQFRLGGGLDLAYTEKTKSDYSVAVVMARVMGPVPEEDHYYVLDVRRAHRPPPEFHEEAIEPLEETYPGIRFRCYLATSEMGSGQFMRKLGTDIEVHRASVDKFQRAQPVAAAWNAGRVHVPAEAPWLKDFLDEVQIFTGVSDKHDDQVDAFAAAFDVLNKKVVKHVRLPLQRTVPIEERLIG
jgi:predicted phage terminase large subunit-like protein